MIELRLQSPSFVPGSASPKNESRHELAPAGLSAFPKLEASEWNPRVRRAQPHQ
jgi:hypothetical protein